VNWFRQNPFLGAFVTVTSVATIAALWFLWSAQSNWNDARSRFEADATELSRLQRLMPFPSGENLRKMKAHAQDYGTAVTKLKEELTTRVLPIAPLQPTEFQSRLRVAMAAAAEKGRGNKVKLPEPFFLGFDEFASALPDTAAAPALAQELAQIEMLLNMLVDARVDAVTSLKRVPAAAAAATPATAARKSPNAAAQPIDRTVVETTFVSSPAAMRRALNAIASADKQFYVVRLLHVRNEKDKGPPREAGADQSAAATANAAQPGKAGTAALNFIVGNEKIETAARIEIVKFNF
jgi:hypothetical protein